MRYMLTDALWAAMEPPAKAARRHRGGHPPGVPDRVFFEALLYAARTGTPWRDLPAEFGARGAAYNRLRRWAASGDLRRLFEALTAAPGVGEVRRVVVDATPAR
ncbi:MAG: transposase, partial [Gemmataceae bacterium]|nr:transposase [Gemmataceae bacterium]